MRAIEQGDSVEEGHLTQLLDFLANLNFDLHLDLGGSAVRATCLLMLPVATFGTGLLSWALLRFVSPLPATEALDLAWVAIHEDRHFYRSVGTGNKW